MRPSPRMSAISLYEAATVLLIRKGRSAVRLLSEYVAESGIIIVDFGSADAPLNLPGREQGPLFRTPSEQSGLATADLCGRLWWHEGHHIYSNGPAIRRAGNRWFPHELSRRRGLRR